MEKCIYRPTLRVRDYERDLQGIMNNASYQHYLRHTRYEFLSSIDVNLAKLHREDVDSAVARASMAFKTPLKSDDEFVSKLYIKRKGIKYVPCQNILRKDDNEVVIKSTAETVCVINGRLGDSESFDRIFAPYLQ